VGTWRVRWGVLLLAAAGLAAADLAATGLSVAAAPSYAPVVAGHPLQFPADYGSHPQFRTEWW
jgi:predicted secreted hydrolase